MATGSVPAASGRDASVLSADHASLRWRIAARAAPVATSSRLPSFITTPKMRSATWAEKAPAATSAATLPAGRPSGSPQPPPAVGLHS